MDRESAVIRAEISHTRAALDRKIGQLEVRAQELTPRQLAQRYLPEYFVDRMIGGVLTLLGVKLAWGMYHRNANRRERLVRRLATGGRW